MTGKASQLPCADLGLSGPSDVDADVKAAMIAAAARVILVADHTKFGRESYVRVARLEDVHTNVTDERKPDKFLRLFEQMGIEIVVASLPGEGSAPHAESTAGSFSVSSAPTSPCTSAPHLKPRPAQFQAAD